MNTNGSEVKKGLVSYEQTIITRGEEVRALLVRNDRDVQYNRCNVPERLMHDIRK